MLASGDGARETGMAFLDWDDRMAVGHDVIDEQHKQLVGLINEIAELAGSPPDGEAVGPRLKQFHDYTMHHFATEQQLMDYKTYPEYFRHLDEHLECSTKALAFYQEFIRNKTLPLPEFLDFLVNWFNTHSMGIDQTLGDYLRKRRAARGGES
jgi:hemerythrin